MSSAAIQVVVMLAALALAPSGDDVDALLARLDGLSSRIDAVGATFTQVRLGTLLDRPLESSGSVRATRTMVRWDTARPYRSVTTVSDGTVKLYHPDHALLEVHELDDHIAALGATPLPRLGALRSRFAMERRPNEIGAPPLARDGAAEPAIVTLRLTPIGERLAEFISEIRLEVSLETGLVLRARITDPGGERTVITFGDITIDEPFDDRDLALTVPPGTRTVSTAAAPRDGGER